MSLHRDVQAPSAGDPVAEPREAIDRTTRATWHLAGRVILTLAVFGASLFVLENYVRALVWAVVLVVALWPLFHRATRNRSSRMKREVGPALFTIAVALVLVVPFALVVIEAAREAHTVLDYAKQAEENGIPVPDAVSRLPASLGKPVTDWWDANLAHAGWAKELSSRLDTASNRELGQHVGRDAIHRLVLIGFAFLAFFFLLRDGDAVRDQCLKASNRVLGRRGERLGRQIVASIHGTVNGLVLVGLGEGVVLGVVYLLTGVPHAILFAALTAVAAMVPFAAPVAFGIAALIVLGSGKAVSAILIVVAGFVTTFTADHFVRPTLIGGATRLPFIWVLLGILGGVETLGLLGLFVGPALMAASISLWRELAEEDGPDEPVDTVGRDRLVTPPRDPSRIAVPAPRPSRA